MVQNVSCEARDLSTQESDPFKLTVGNLSKEQSASSELVTLIDIARESSVNRPNVWLFKSVLSITGRIPTTTGGEELTLTRWMA